MLFLALLPGIITILCHRLNFASPAYDLSARSILSMTRPSGSNTMASEQIGVKRAGSAFLPRFIFAANNGFTLSTGGIAPALPHIPAGLRARKDNVVPVITGQKPDPLTTSEDNAITIHFTDLTVEDADNRYPKDFTLEVGDGEHFIVSGKSVTPENDFTGTLSVPVTVNDGTDDSDPYDLKIMVTPVNDVPVITGQSTLVTNEETPLTINATDLIVSDPDNSYPTDFALTLLPGTGYSIDGNVILPATDFSGLLSVPVIVNDGTADSAPFDLAVTVQPVNDTPVITDQVPISTAEGQAVALELSQLIVADPDNEYPADFTLAVLAGDHYSVAGNLITPAQGFNGSLGVPVFVNDGMASSEVFSVSITVDPVNDPPVITAQIELETAEDAPITITLQDLSVTDADDQYPVGFTLTVLPGTNYVFSGTTVTPSANFNGSLSVNVVVNDGVGDSEPYPLLVTVSPVNDPPTINGPASLSTPEDTPRTIALTDLMVSDPDDSYPEGFTLTVFPGTGYSVSGNTVSPLPDFSGTLSVQVQVNDGLLNSNIYVLPFEVAPVNDPPVITGQTPVETGEDTPVTISFAQLTVLDVDNVYPSGFSLVILPGKGYTFSGSTVTPADNFNGTLNVNLAVNDGSANSAPFVFQIQVGDSNDAPVITGQRPLTTDEEKPVVMALSDLVVSDPDDAYPTGFALLIAPGLHYTVSGHTITPDVDFSGRLTIPVRVNDGINNSASFDFQLEVSQVNDPPSFAPISNQQVAENTAGGTLTITRISKGPFEDEQQLTFVATSGNTAVMEDPVVLYDGTSSQATLSYTVKPNKSGIVNITVRAIDNGSNIAPNRNSYQSDFQINVLEINSSPTLDPISDVNILEDAELQNLSLTGISEGPGESQVLTLSVSSDKPGFFDLLEAVYTGGDQAGLLRFKTKANASGTAKVSVTVTDDGSGESPNVNSITRAFTLVVQPVNDPPVFTSMPPLLAAVGEPYEYRVTATDVDGGKIGISATAKPSWTSLNSEGNGVAILKGRPPASALGWVQIDLEVNDGQSTAQQSYRLYVNARPSVTSLVMMTKEDNALTFSSAFFNGGYSDANGDALVAVQVIRVPGFGKLSLPGREIKPGDTLAAASLGDLVYTPAENYAGDDSFGWQAFDGYHMSLTPGRVDISVLPVNDPPYAVFETDTLQYEVNGEPAFLVPAIVLADPDDDTLTHATIAFLPRHYRPEADRLQFTRSGGVRGQFDFQAGRLELSGKASLKEYESALRSVRYLHENTLDPLLEPKTISLVLDDGQTQSQSQEMVVLLKYTFIEFNIPSGFTPNGDQANDTWIIERPGGGLEELNDAVISVYNKKGVLVFRTTGFNHPWDGTMQGEQLPADSYFFTIDLGLRNKKTYKGVVTILR